MTDKIVERPLKVAQWKVQLSYYLAGMEVEGVFLKGNRGRPWPLRKVSEAEFRCRFPIDQPDAHVLRSTPSMWTMRGPILHLWPSPAHEWTLEVRLVKREMVA